MFAIKFIKNRFIFVQLEINVFNLHHDNENCYLPGNENLSVQHCHI